MLKRIQAIRHIGRFADCKAAGCEFHKDTIVFGLNTQGKSTLTAILRSLDSNNNDLMIGRKTFGATGAKYIELDFEENAANTKYIFQNRKWNKPFASIAIFDSTFIADNIFTGDHITFDHQRNLNTIIIGKKGQELNKEIADLQKQSESYASQKGDKTKEFARHFPGVAFDTFKALPKDDNIDDRIREKDRDIKFERDKEEIKRAIQAHIQSLLGIRFAIRDTLAKTLSIKQEEIEQHIKSHFATDTNARNFLSDGLAFLKDTPTDGSKRTCVFCGQELGSGAESLIAKYSAFFKGGYEELQKEINDAIDYFRGINLEAILEKIAADLRAKEISVGLDEDRIRSLVDLKKLTGYALDSSGPNL